MKNFVITGGNRLNGTTIISGAKNVSLKVLVAACLTDEEVIIHNIPLISDVMVMLDIIRELGGEVHLEEHTVKIKMEHFATDTITLDRASHIRTSSMFLAPLLIRNHSAIIPNPGGCRIGARPIDWTIEGLKLMGADIDYESLDGYFHARAEKLEGITYRFKKNTHTGTETLILASVCANGKTILENAALEPEVDELITFLNTMGASIKRTGERTIEIEGVEKLHSTSFTISADRNEIVTFAIAAYVTQGDIFVSGAKRKDIDIFLDKLDEVGAAYEEKEDGIRFYHTGGLRATDVITAPYPGFMTDWQAPWAVLMSVCSGKASIHEAVFSNRFGYVKELRKMGAKISFYHPHVENPSNFYNFDVDVNEKNPHAIYIEGPVKLHDAIVSISDLRAGASLVLAALAATGETVIHGVELIDRGYEDFQERLSHLGARIRREDE
ncbi:MAG: UDP-N-acetylglucosamine 1-carboxyvinyltransferase [Candidatus Levybacteria bacterium]|nr:UDP-N-acetylglucosamine 1-carboxyvinyltransferase [Candidatus Levybacteria bacterium]